jgi:DNA invertase Pin-like site-specific DNA recombinase
MFGMLSVFAEFERSIIRERVLAGMARPLTLG